MAYRITESDEPNRLRLEFDDASFGADAMRGVNRVGGRRDADGQITHYVFPPEVRGDVEAAVVKAADRFEAQIAWDLEFNQQRQAAAAAAASKAEVDDAKRAADLARWSASAATVKAEITSFVAPGTWMSNDTSLVMPYAEGIPSRLKAVGCAWDKEGRRWVFNRSRRAAVEALLPELKLLVARQMKRDEKKKSAPKRKTRLPKAAAGLHPYADASDDQLEWLAMDGVLGNNINANARDLRRDLRTGRI